MLALTLAAALSYAFPSGTKATYDLTVSFEGYLPILGRPQNKAEVRMAIEVRGGERDAEGNWVIAYEVKEMQASANGVSLPFTVTNVAAYFPPAKLTVSPLGKVLKTDAPNVAMPIRLPGLDSRRLPEISFLPLEFPVQTVESPIRKEQPWTFNRKFGDGEITFTAEALELGEKEASFRVTLRQVQTSFEDASGAPARGEAQRAVQLDAILAGTGKVTFSPATGQAAKWEAEYDVKTTATQLKTNETSLRTLATKVKVERRP